MSVKRYKTLDAWITEALSDQEKGSACTLITCVYRRPTGGTREIHGVKLEGKTWDPEQLASVLKGKAESFSQDLPGIQNFELQAYYGKQEPEAAHPFVVLDGELQSAGIARTPRESPDGPGIITAAMKHAETAYSQLNTLVQATSVTAMQREQRLDARIATLELEVTDSYKIIRDMLMDTAKANHEYVMKQLEFQRASEERKRMLELMPALANTASGRELFPVETADTALIEMIATKVKPELINQLMASGVIPKEVAGPLVARLAAITEKRENESKELAKVPPMNSDPRREAEGN